MTLNVFEIAEFIKFEKELIITKLNLDLYSIEEWLEAIYPDPELVNYPILKLWSLPSPQS